MRKLLYPILVVFLGIGFSFVLSMFLFGKERAVLGIKYYLNGFKASEKPVSYYARSRPPSSVLGINEDNYAAIDESEVKPIKFKKRASAFLVPTNGIAAHKDFLYDPIRHGGIDIWTTVDGKGLSAGSSKGYPIYAACSGYVIRVYHPNQEIEIKCDPIPEKFKDEVPSLDVKILYAHLGDAVTKESYHSLRVGQKVTKGELVGYQGNVSSIVPINRVTHLHFGVYDTSGSGIPPTLDPRYYIGVPTQKVGQIFKVNHKEHVKTN